MVLPFPPLCFMFLSTFCLCCFIHFHDYSMTYILMTSQKSNHLHKDVLQGSHVLSQIQSLYIWWKFSLNSHNLGGRNVTLCCIILHFPPQRHHIYLKDNSFKVISQTQYLWARIHTLSKWVRSSLIIHLLNEILN